MLTYCVQPGPEAVVVVERDLCTIHWSPGRGSVALGEDGTALAWDLRQQHQQPLLVRHLALLVQHRLPALERAMLEVGFTSKEDNPKATLKHPYHPKASLNVSHPD